MIELRQILGPSGLHLKLQYRFIPSEIGWISSDDKPVWKPQEPINFNMEKNFSEWMDVPVVFYEEYKKDQIKSFVNDATKG